MKTFYVHSTYPAYVTDVSKIEADSLDDAYEKNDADNNASKYLGSTVGDHISWVGGTETEIKEAVVNRDFILVPETKGDDKRVLIEALQHYGKHARSAAHEERRRAKNANAEWAVKMQADAEAAERLAKSSGCEEEKESKT